MAATIGDHGWPYCSVLRGRKDHSVPPPSIVKIRAPAPAYPTTTNTPLLPGFNIDNALLKLNGIKTEDEVNSEEHTLRIKTCLRCPELDSPTSTFCSRCASPLDMKTAMQLHQEESKTDDVMDWLMGDPEFKEFIRSKLKTMAMAIGT